MTSSDQDDFVDRVAQAVIDKIEERDKIAFLVEQIAHRVIAIQKHEAALKEAAQSLSDGNNADAADATKKSEE